MHLLRRSSKHLIGFLLILLITGAAGCASSAQAKYVQKLTARVKHQSTPSSGVAMAFDLDEYSETALASADGASPPVQ